MLKQAIWRCGAVGSIMEIDMLTWYPITEQPKDEHAPTVLIFSPSQLADEDYPGHCMHTSNIDYIRNGNAERQGYTLWAPFNYPDGVKG